LSNGEALSNGDNRLPFCFSFSSTQVEPSIPKDNEAAKSKAKMACSMINQLFWHVETESEF